MYKNQLQELAQRSCFNLPSYMCIREGPDHAPRFKAAVNFNGEIFESPSFCTTLRQAEHSAAEVALNSLSHRGPSHSLAARILDETGVYKNLLQEISQRVGAPLPSYTTFRSGLGHLPVFMCTVELAGIVFTGEPAKNKKQAEKNAAMAAWSSLKQLAWQAASASNEPENSDEQEQIRIAKALLNYRLKEKMTMANNPNASSFLRKFPMQPDKTPSTLLQPPPPEGSKILPFIHPKSMPRSRPISPSPSSEGLPHKFPAAGARPYVPVQQQYRMPPYHRMMAPPVTIRTAVPVFSAPPLPPPDGHHHHLPSVMGPQPIRMASPVRIRQAVPVFAAPPPAPVVTRPAPTKEQLPSTVLKERSPSPVVKEQSSCLRAVVIEKGDAKAVAVADDAEVTKDDVKVVAVVDDAEVTKDYVNLVAVEEKLMDDAEAKKDDAKSVAVKEKIVGGPEANELEECASIERLKQLDICKVSSSQGKDCWGTGGKRVGRMCCNRATEAA